MDFNTIKTIFRDFTIRKKLNVLLMSAGTVAVLLACIVFYFMTTSHFRKAYEDDLTSLARIIGHNCEASLAFRIPEEAERVLASLAVRPSVVYAVVRDLNGNILAAYEKDPQGVRVPGKRSEEALSGYLKVNHDIRMGSSVIGSLALYDNMSGINKARLLAVSVMFFALFVSMCMAFAMVSPLQRLISGPIVALSASAERISEEQDFSLRAEKQGNDEVGHLVDAFNNMIVQVEKRNKELLASEKRFRSLVDQAVDAFFLLDHDGRIVDVNQRACDSLGYTREELLSLTFRDIDGNDESAVTEEKPWAHLQLFVTVTNESMHRRKDGTTFPVEMRLGLVDIGGGLFVMGSTRDISERREAEAERRKLESRLLQSQKMEAVGVLAGGIAHDFNNILTAIIGYVELAKMKLDRDNPAYNSLEQVLKAGMRASDLVKQILTFSRQTIQDKTPVKVQLVIKEALKLLRASIPTSIEIKQNIDSDCGSVLANPTQIHQILMNLCTNAYHAMRTSGGVLGVSLEPLEITGNDVNKLLDLSPGRYVRLTVSDTGHGMDKDVLERIFEPYFTTKSLGEGTGMGLSVVHGIVKSYQGHISVYSEPGIGTIFNVYLPMIDDAPACVTADRKALERGSERLLIVDDEEQIVVMEKEMFTQIGYAVTACLTPEQALETFRKSPDAFDLVITDMTMPKMTGDKLALELLRTRPDIPIILCTGFSERINEEAAKAIGIREYVMKPIVLTEFSETIRKVLGPKTCENTDTTRS